MSNIQHHCVACANTPLYSVIDFGLQVAVNKLTLSPSHPEPKFNLALNACESCSHGQMQTFVDPVYLFENYHYASGTSQTLKHYFAWLAKAVATAKPDGSVLELASNDGSFLSQLLTLKIKAEGMDPATTMIANAKQKGIPCYEGFWPESAHLLTQKYDVVVAQNVLAHTPNPYAFLAAIPDVLKDDGLLIIQTSQIHMLERGQFDTIYHEHYSFYTPFSMKTILKRAGFHVLHQYIVDIHGDSMITIAAKSDTVAFDNTDFQSPPFFMNLIQAHPLTCTDIHDQYGRFATLAKTSITETHNWVSHHRAQGHQIVFVGAAAKALTYLNISGITPDLLVDGAAEKIGKYDPTGSMKISAIQDVASIEEPIACVVSAWNFYTELVNQIRTCRPTQTTYFYRYFPTPQEE